MNYTYFLGSNSKDGFYSIYNSFPPKKDDYVHILKGGPGSGKSSFMRKMALKAEELGYSVHYILCSGDPGSLDGVYIPEKKLAFLDGTNPHPREPEVFGVNSDYIHLGQFFKGGLSDREKDYVNCYAKDYKQKYANAYHLLSASVEIQKAVLPQMYGESETAAVQHRIDGILGRSSGKHEATDARIVTRFLSCVGCYGDFRLNTEFEKLCKLVYQFDNQFGGADMALRHVVRRGKERGEDMILCPNPITPEKLSAVIFPERELGFTDGSWELKKSRRVHIDSVLPAEKCALLKPQLKEAEKIQKKIMDLAFKKLSEAKDLHDLLEQQYKPHIDFEALSEYTNQCVENYFA